MSPRFEVRFETKLDLVVEVEADDEERAELAAGELAEAYLSTATGDGRDVRAAASLDGVGAYESTELTERPAGLAEHRMLPGSHERLRGAECVCGGAWDRWLERCAKQPE